MNFIIDEVCFFKGRSKHNCWVWLNLTEDGHVECDASIMDGDYGTFGAVGAVLGIPEV